MWEICSFPWLIRVPRMWGRGKGTELLEIYEKTKKIPRNFKNFKFCRQNFKNCKFFEKLCRQKFENVDPSADSALKIKKIWQNSFFPFSSTFSSFPPFATWLHMLHIRPVSILIEKIWRLYIKTVFDQISVKFRRFFLCRQIKKNFEKNIPSVFNQKNSVFLQLFRQFPKQLSSCSSPFPRLKFHVAKKSNRWQKRSVIKGNYRNIARN